jgi:hypothetical protein
MVLFAAALLLVFRCDYVSSVVFAVMAAVNLVIVLPLDFESAPPAPAGAVSCRAMLANVNTKLGNPQRVANAIEHLKPDVLVLEDVDEEWLKSLPHI